MGRTFPLALGLLIVGSGAFVACASDDDPEPGFTQTGGSGDAPVLGAGGAQGGQAGRGGSGGSSAGQAGAGGQGGGGGAAGGGGQGDVCGNDPNEPNDVLDDARQLNGQGDGKISDCDNEESTFGQLGGEDDEDWFFFTGVDDVCFELSDNIQPHVKLATLTPFVAEVCIFVLPLTPATASAVCASGSTRNNEFDARGYVGCCGANEARATVGANGQNDETDVRIRVSKLSGALCGGYEITYGNNSD